MKGGPFLKLHIAILLAGFTGILGRLITLNEGLLVWYRMMFSAAGLLLLPLLSGRIPRPARGGWLPLTGVGALVALHWVFFYGSIKYSNVSVSLVCFSAVGFFTALLEPAVERRPISPLELLLGLLVMLGIYVIFRFDGRYGTGIFLGLVAAFLSALFTVLNRPLVRRHGTMAVTLWEMAGGCLLLTILLPFYLQAFPPTHVLPTLSDFLWLLFLSILCTVVAFRLSLSALMDISPFTVNLSYNLEPVYGILLAFVVYEENRELGQGFYIGLSIIVLTVGFQSWRVWRQSRLARKG